MGVWTSVATLSLIPIVHIRAQIESDSLVAAWLFDKVFGNIAADSSGNGLNGRLVGSPTWVHGKFGKALDFDGSGDAVLISGFGNVCPTDEITIVAWVMLEGKKNQDFCFHDPGVPFDSRIAVHLPWNDGNNDLIQWQFGTPFGVTSVILPDDMVGHWTHLAFTASDRKMQIYKDAKLIAAGKGANSFDFEQANRAWHIGGRIRDKTTFDGKIDEVGVFNVALTQDEIERIMKRGLAGVIPAVALHKLDSTWKRIKANY